MTASELIEGLTIITKYEPGAQVSAEHDELCAGEYNVKAMTKEDRKRMKAMGWFEQYDSWCHFT